MTKYNQYYEGLKFFFNDFSKPFEKLIKSLKSKWERGLRINKLKRELIKDMELMKRVFFDKKHIDNIVRKNYKSLPKKIDKRTLKELKIVEFLKKVDTVEKGEDYEKVVTTMFDNFYTKLDKRLERVIHKMESSKSKTLIQEVEFDEESSLSKNEYKKQKIQLQIELVKLQEWVVANNKRVAIVFEGRDAAGKGSSIKRFVEHLNPKSYRVVALGIPTKEESNNWLDRYAKHLPNDGEIVFFDRSWYNRGVIEPTMDYCTEDQYKKFITTVNGWEGELIDSEIILIKFWFSIDKEKQLERFENRKASPLKHWKYSPNDEKTISKWEIMTNYKDQMFEKTSTPKSPWVVLNSNDKRVSRLNSIRYVLSKIDYTGKDLDKQLTPSEDIVKILD
jgi:polyphosphate kinase 2